MNVKEVRAELKEIDDLLNDCVNDELVYVQANYVVPDRYDSAYDREANTNRNASYDFDWMRETLEECLDALELPHIEELMKRAELLSLLEKNGLKEWDIYKKAQEGVTDFSERSSMEEFEPGQIVKGTIQSIKPYGVFVRIAPKIDALSWVKHMEIEEGMEVAFRIGSIDIESNRIKGEVLYAM